MVTRTHIKQQIMRQQFMEEEKQINNSVIQTNNFPYFNSACNSNMSGNCLPSLTSTLTPQHSGESFQYIKPYENPQNSYVIDSPSYQSLQSSQHNNSGGYNVSSSSYPTPSSVYSQQHQQQLHYSQYHHTPDPLQAVSPLDTDQLSFYSPCHLPEDKRGRSDTATGNSSLNPASIGASQAGSGKDKSKKESHNRIERKRRDFINQQITELSNLIPAQMLSDSDSKKNKGNILKNSVDYIQHLQGEQVNMMNLLKETRAAFQLLELYRKGFHMDQENQLEDTTSLLENKYGSYLQLHDINQRVYQQYNTGSVSHQPLLQSRCGKPPGILISGPAVNQHHSYHSSPNDIYASQQQQHSANSTVAPGSFKLEPSSVHSSSLGANNSVQSGVRLDADFLYSPLTDHLMPHYLSSDQNVTVQSEQITLHAHSEPTYLVSGGQFKNTAPLDFESMEC